MIFGRGDIGRSRRGDRLGEWCRRRGGEEERCRWRRLDRDMKSPAVDCHVCDDSMEISQRSKHDVRISGGHVDNFSDASWPAGRST